MKCLVAYFSAGGVTAALAEKLAQAIGAETFEIRPETRYTKEDLDWTNDASRSSLEMKDRSCRPPMAGKPDLQGVDAVFVGFPVWWYREPSIIDTFMESTDFSGKVVAPFCTSGGSGIGDSASNLLALAPGAKVKEGKRFAAHASARELKAWAEEVLK